MNSDTKTRFEHFCQINPNDSPGSVRLTGIVCTVANPDVEQLVNFMKAGMNIVRLNCSHGTQDEQRETIENIRKAVKEFNKKYSKKFPFPLAIALDTKGPEIRTGNNDGNCDIELQQGCTVMLTTDKACMCSGSSEKLFIDYPELPQVVKPGTEIYIDKGLICLVVRKVLKNEICCEVVYGGTLGSRKALNIPSVKLNVPDITEKDRTDIRLGMDEEVDFIFASFIRSADAVKQIKKLLCGQNMKIIAKIETKEGVCNIDEILAEADGILIARGDLGVEIPQEKVPVVQKMIIARCNRAGKPCLLAAQMMRSMITKSRATRAEISDVANAAFDNADCTFLSGETAKGKYQLESILTMANTLVEAEAACFQRSLFEELVLTNELPLDATHSIAIGAVEAAMKNKASSIIVLTPDGKAAQLLSKYRPPCPILAVTKEEVVARQMQIHRCVLPLYYDGNLSKNKFQ
jgi:pyruvate kinase